MTERCSADYVFFEWEGQHTFLVYSAPDEFIYDTQGEIFCDVSEDGSMSPKEFIGKFCVYYVDVDQVIEEGAPLYDVFDSHSEGVENYYGAIFDSKTGFMSERLLRLFGHEVYGNNVLIIERLEIVPEFRKRSLGLIIMRRLIQRFSAGAGIVAIKPFPLQFERHRKKEEDRWMDRMKLSEFCQDERKATLKLRRYYGRLGFVGLRGTPFMFRSTALRMLSIQELLKAAP